DLLRRGAINKIVVERTAYRAEGNRIARLLAEIEPGAPGVVEKNSIAARAVNRMKKGDGLVQRVDRFLRPDVSLPQCVRLFPAVELSCLVAQAEVVFGIRHLLEHRKSAGLELCRTAHRIGRDHIAFEIADDDAERIAR